MRASDRIEELSANPLESAQDVFDYLATIRKIHQGLAVETSIAGPHLRALLMYTNTGEHTTPRRAARRVANGFKKMAELEIASSSVSTKTWSAMCTDFLIKTKDSAKKKGLTIDL